MAYATIATLTVRTAIGGRRLLLILALPAVLLILAVVIRALVGVDDDARAAVVGGLGLGVVMPLIALILGTGVLAAEIDDGSIVYLLAKPVSRHTIVVNKYAVAVAASVAAAVVPVALAAAIMSGDAMVTLGYAGGALLGVVAYGAIFVLLSAMTRHAVAFGLVYVFAWEGLAGSLLEGVRWLSVSHWSLAVAVPVMDDDLLGQAVSPAYAIIATTIVTVGGLWLAGERLRSFRFSGEE
jgi:ABC-2 type transport system permease protein